MDSVDELHDRLLLQDWHRAPDGRQHDHARASDSGSRDSRTRSSRAESRGRESSRWPTWSLRAKGGVPVEARETLRGGRGAVATGAAPRALLLPGKARSGTAETETKTDDCLHHAGQQGSGRPADVPPDASNRPTSLDAGRHDGRAGTGRRPGWCSWRRMGIRADLWCRAIGEWGSCRTSAVNLGRTSDANVLAPRRPRRLGRSCSPAGATVRLTGPLGRPSPRVPSTVIPGAARVCRTA